MKHSYSLLVIGVALLGGLASASAQTLFSANFSPATIGPGSSSTLTFTIDNSGSAVAATDLAFTDVLPSGVVLATPAHPSWNGKS
uniref:DUF7933 domain-containing protein n=1 Tax=Pontiella sp. TaxID=2837462 RepID=UPI00356A68F3